MISVEEALTTEVFQAAKVVGGKEGLKKNIKNVTVAEVPDAANWLHGGELVCTTAYFISREVKFQVEWIKSLSDNGATALAIKTDRFLGEIPVTIISIANQLNFPIIEMPPQITWPDIIESVMNPILNYQVKTLQRAEEIHNKLTSLVLEDESLKVIADEISALVRNPIIIEDARLNHIATGESNLSNTTSWQKYLDKRLSRFFRKQITNTSFYGNAIRNKTKESLELTLQLDNEKINNIVIPIYSNRVTYGFITLMDTTNEITEIDLIALKHGASTIALQLMKQAIHKQTLQNKYLALVDDLVHGRIHSELVNEYRMRDSVKDQVMSIAVVDLNIDQKNLEKRYIWDRTENVIIDMIKQELLKSFQQVIIGNDESLFTVIVFQSSALEGTFTKDFQRVLVSVLNRCKELKLLKNFRGGIGSSYNELKKLGRPFKEANTALSIANSLSLDTNEPILLYEALGIHRIISMVNDYEKLNTFYQEFLGDLRAYDQKNNDVLMETLHMYLKCNCVVVETANKLYIHSNTVSYRLKKIQNIVKHDLNTLEFRLTYLFALEAYHVLHTYN